MTDEGTRVVAAVARLRAAIERTAAALATPDLETLLDTESEIQQALAGIGAAGTLPAEERQALREQVEAASRALVRCRRLGAGLDDFVRTSLFVQGRSADYGPRRSADVPYAGQAFDARM